MAIDRDRLYEVIRVFSHLPRGNDRSQPQYVYDQLTEDELKVLAEEIINTVVERAPADGMFGHSVQLAGTELLDRFNYAETIPLTKSVVGIYQVSKPGFIDLFLPILQSRAGSCLLVEPDPKIVDFCEEILFSYPSFYSAEIAATRP